MPLRSETGSVQLEPQPPRLSESYPRPHLSSFSTYLRGPITPVQSPCQRHPKNFVRSRAFCKRFIHMLLSRFHVQLIRILLRLIQPRSGSVLRNSVRRLSNLTQITITGHSLLSSLRCVSKGLNSLRRPRPEVGGYSSLHRRSRSKEDPPERLSHRFVRFSLAAKKADVSPTARGKRRKP